MRKLKQKNEGITLIALVVTIVVLLILAGITIGTLTGDNGIIKEARNSKEDVEQKALEEQVEAAIIIVEQKYRNPTLDQVIAEIKKIETVDSVDQETGKVVSTLGYVIEGKLDVYLSPYNTASTLESAKKQNKPFEKQTPIEDSSNKTVKIPAGFKIASDSAETVAEGVVIEDATGNQFVWVPVDNMENFKTIEGYYNNMLESLSAFYSEPFASGYSIQVGTETITETSDYNAMRKSVEENKGFYIGRFEAGNDGSGNVVIKKGANVYNSVPWGNSMSDIEGTSNTGGKVGAVKLSKEFSKNNNYQGVTSTLCYGVQWDTTLKFIDPDYTGFAKDSSKQGWYSDNYNKTDSGNTQTNPSHVTGKDLIYNDKPKVIANKQKNIYDMAGNVWEWTMEAYDYDTGSRVGRGGSYNIDGSNLPASSRDVDRPAYLGAHIGFRVALYL